MRFFPIICIIVVLVMMAACNSTKLSEIEAVLPTFNINPMGRTAAVTIFRGRQSR